MLYFNWNEESSMFDENLTILFLLLAGIGVHLLFFGGSGGYVLYHTICARRKAAASMNWPSVPGKIVSSQIVEMVVRDSDGTNRGLQLDAEYEYTVNGIPYINNKRTPGKVAKNIPYKKAQEVADHYAVDKIVPVYYNPHNHQESYLEREVPLGNLTLIIGIILLVIAACGVCAFGTMTARLIGTMISG